MGHVFVRSHTVQFTRVSTTYVTTVNPLLEPFLRVIDCRTRRIVKAPPQCKYVALSYVWGLLKQEQQTSSNSTDAFPCALPENLPRLIEDALMVVRQLDFRNLWIDKYCICQNDQDDLHNQIRNMDIIFSLAQVTIVAAAGIDPTFGLPGIRDTPRIPQPVVMAGGCALLSILTNPRIVVQASKWMSRGWTYREAVFARRRLVFTEEQVHFECNIMQCSEVRKEPFDISAGGSFGTMKKHDVWAHMRIFQDPRGPV